MCGTDNNPADPSQINWKVANALSLALVRASPRACVEAPAQGEASVIDGVFDMLLVARQMNHELHRVGLAIVEKSKDE